jgi:hypothetical protein
MPTEIIAYWPSVILAGLLQAARSSAGFGISAEAKPSIRLARWRGCSLRICAWAATRSTSLCRSLIAPAGALRLRGRRAAKARTAGRASPAGPASSMIIWKHRIIPSFILVAPAGRARAASGAALGRFRLLGEHRLEVVDERATCAGGLARPPRLRSLAWLSTMCTAVERRCHLAAGDFAIGCRAWPPGRRLGSNGMTMSTLRSIDCSKSLRLISCAPPDGTRLATTITLACGALAFSQAGCGSCRGSRPA